MKKVLKVAVLGASVVALASAASAADLNMNIFGASAQGKFWNTYAETFLKAAEADGGMGCASATKGYADSAKKLGITVGYNCTGNGGDDVYIRYTSDKSVEGPRAVMNQNPQGTGCTNPGERKQAHWDGSAYSTPCLDVHVGASDVASESFTQESHGNKNGNYDPTPWNEVLDPATIPGLDQIGTAERPIVVPFAFFANNSLTANNLTRQQILLLMSGSVNKWNQFGPGYDNKKVVLCMRHAGSGTHATLDKAIMRGDKSLPKEQALNVPPVVPKPGIMFHESSGDMMKCINENGGYTTASAVAIGYADADAIVSSYNTDGSENNANYPNVKRIKYNGVGEGMTAANLVKYGYSPLKNEIINGIYEFWSAQWMYINAAQENQANSATVDLYNKMMAYASSTTLPCPGLGCYWMTGDELKVLKENDTSIPHF